MFLPDTPLSLCSFLGIEAQLLRPNGQGKTWSDESLKKKKHVMGKNRNLNGTLIFFQTDDTV